VTIQVKLDEPQPLAASSDSPKDEEPPNPLIFYNNPDVDEMAVVSVDEL